MLFHCQQAAEKALKAYLTWNDQPFRRVHDLEELIRQCATVNAEMVELLEAGHTLSPYAVDPRYPSDDAEPTVADREEAQRLARLVLDFVLARLPPAVQP